MSSSRLYRIGGIVLIIAAVLQAIASVAITFVFPDTGPDVAMSVVTTSTWSMLFSLNFISIMLLLFGLIGLYLYQARKAGVLGLLGFLSTFLGYLFSGIVASFFFMSVMPYLATKGTSAFKDAFDTVGLFGLGGGALLVLGLVLLGISMMRAKVFPRLAGILILISGILAFAGILGLNFIVSLIGSVGTIAECVALAWIGYILFTRSQVQVEAVAQPSLSIAPQA